MARSWFVTVDMAAALGMLDAALQQVRDGGDAGAALGAVRHLAGDDEQVWALVAARWFRFWHNGPAPRVDRAALVAELLAMGCPPATVAAEALSSCRRWAVGGSDRWGPWSHAVECAGCDPPAEGWWCGEPRSTVVRGRQWLEGRGVAGADVDAALARLGVAPHHPDDATVGEW